jgi:hypothetical protein
MSDSIHTRDFGQVVEGETLSREPALVDAGALAAAASNDARMRGTRLRRHGARRFDDARALFSSDDGFRLFRVF